MNYWQFDVQIIALLQNLMIINTVDQKASKVFSYFFSNILFLWFACLFVLLFMKIKVLFYVYFCATAVPKFIAVSYCDLVQHNLILPVIWPRHRIYHQTSNIRCTKSRNLNASRLVLQLSLPNPLKPGVKSSVHGKVLTLIRHLFDGFLTLGLFGRRVIVVTCVCPSVRLSVCLFPSSLLTQ